MIGNDPAAVDKLPVDPKTLELQRLEQQRQETVNGIAGMSKQVAAKITDLSSYEQNKDKLCQLVVGFDLFSTISDFRRGVRFTMPTILDVTRVDEEGKSLFDSGLVDKYREDLGKFEDGLRQRVLEGFKPNVEMQEIRKKMKRVLLGEIASQK